MKTKQLFDRKHFFTECAGKHVHDHMQVLYHTMLPSPCPLIPSPFPLPLPHHFSPLHSSQSRVRYPQHGSRCEPVPYVLQEGGNG
jgi:hypothetical protein